MQHWLGIWTFFAGILRQNILAKLLLLSTYIRVTNKNLFYGIADGNNNFNGLGKILYENGSLFKGEILNNQKHGKGIYINKGKYLYEGNFKNDTPFGLGIMYGAFDKLGLAIKEGNFTDEIEVDGIAKVALFSSSSVYVGPLKNNTIMGKGMMTLTNEIQYIGEFADGNFEGEGKLSIPKSKITFKGNFKKSIFFI